MPREELVFQALLKWHRSDPQERLLMVAHRRRNHWPFKTIAFYVAVCGVGVCASLCGYINQWQGVGGSNGIWPSWEKMRRFF